MSGIAAVFLMGVLGLVTGPGPAPIVTPGEFQEWFLEAYNGDLEIPEEVQQHAAGFRYVFVAGLQNERMSGYFVQNIKELQSLGVPKEMIHQIRPSSHATFEENLEAIRTGFRMVASLGPEPLVVIAHSKGACDALAFALRDPDFVRDHVEIFFLVQGPFGGSGLADYVFGDGEAIDDQMPGPARGLARVLGKFQENSLVRGKHAGMLDLTRDAANLFWKRTLEENAEAIPIVSPRTFYIEARIDPTDQRLLRKPIAWYLHTYYGPNDGMVASGDQSLKGVGTSLGMLEVGHTDLTHRFPGGRGQRQLRKALSQSVIMTVGRQVTEDQETLKPSEEEKAVGEILDSLPPPN